jgi:ubiquinol-cytochrome c reductase cytochrome c subunit
MPAFPASQIDQKELDSLVRYVLWTHEADERGGWGLGFVGPFTEGIVAWLVGAAALVLVMRLLGERAE